MNWLKLFSKIEGYLPKWLKDRIVTYFLKKQVKGIFNFTTKPEDVYNSDAVECTQLGEALRDPKFLEALKVLQADREKFLGIDKKK